MYQSAKKALQFISVLLLLLVIAIYMRSYLAIEMNVESLNNWINNAGAAAPIAAILLVACRFLIGIPSHLALLTIGIVFGTLAGTIYGATGLIITGSAVFLMARFGGRDAVEDRIPKRYEKLMTFSGNRGGAIMIALMTGYPLFPITPPHALAGLTSMPFTLFLLSISLGSLVRAACYAFFGSTLTSGDPIKILEVTVFILVVICIPLLFRKVRGRIRMELFTQEK